MIGKALSAIAGLIGTAIDKAIPDKDEAARLKASINSELITLSASELEQAGKIITAEADGESWLQRNWRPVTMLTFTGLVAAHWLGWTAPGLAEDQVLALLEIVKIGLGGYVVGRSAEKVVRQWSCKQ
ncbi:3TM-type holin [Endozoicomonas sp. GU-1]|uniref:3TM-type holin n=1 Tax=Endozoicomonas sp. GU-1 TaxID=3009078 RepID=UPI0022B2EB0C|nr:3TM-type holin [Endozoicomonas sp. GU-1]WBA79568.1 3TM-type holin [Endozoicomonas sp. GU-1]